jgi:hypothetical protein
MQSRLPTSAGAHVENHPTPPAQMRADVPAQVWDAPAQVGQQTSTKKV